MEQNENLEGEIIDETPEETPETPEEQDKAALYLDKLQRLTAEFENFRNRNIKEKAMEYNRGVKEAVLGLLPVIDNFGRSLEQANKEDAFVKGIIMIESQLNGLLESLGVEKIKTLGEQFDPNLHSAISHIEDKEKGANEIVQELQAGYMYKGNVIRHSMVIVAN